MNLMEKQNHAQEERETNMMFENPSLAFKFSWAQSSCHMKIYEKYFIWSNLNPCSFSGGSDSNSFLLKKGNSPSSDSRSNLKSGSPAPPLGGGCYDKESKPPLLTLCNEWSFKY